MPFIENLDLGWIEMTMDAIQKTFLVLRPFKGALTCSILIPGTQISVRVRRFSPTFYSDLDETTGHRGKNP
jgi:hypothetical protein